MRYDSLDHSSTSSSELSVYECEIHLKFRLVEEKSAFTNRDQILELLLDAFSYGSDEFMEPIQIEAVAQEVCELMASPQMRRQLIRLRNSSDVA
jgi:hypothetical protein